jgi:putative ABC transport system permease protein
VSPAVGGPGAWPSPVTAPVWLLPAAVLTVLVTAFLTVELPTRRVLRMPPAEMIGAQ